MQVRASTDIATPSETVFACVDEPAKIVRWVEGAIDHVYTSDRDPANPVGQRFRQRVKQGPSIRAFDGEIIAWEQPRHFGLRIPTPSYSSEAHFHITSTGPASSHVDYTIDIALHTVSAKIIGTVLRVPLGFFVKKQMKRLKTTAEQVHTEASR